MPDTATTQLLDARGFKRAKATLPGHGKGRPPRNKGRRYPPDPPAVQEIVALLGACRDDACGHRLRALIIVLWRSGLRVSEALALEERDLNQQTGALVVRNGKGGKRRIVGMDPWGWDQLHPWLQERQDYPIGPIFCVLNGPTAGRQMNAMQVRLELRRLREQLGIRRRIAPHQLRHGLAVDWVRENNSVHLLQRQLGHSSLGVTTKYLEGVTNDEVLDVSVQRRAPQMPVPDLMGTLRG